MSVVNKFECFMALYEDVLKRIVVELVAYRCLSTLSYYWFFSLLTGRLLLGMAIEKQLHITHF